MISVKVTVSIQGGDPVEFVADWRGLLDWRDRHGQALDVLRAASVSAERWLASEHKSSLDDKE